MLTLQERHEVLKWYRHFSIINLFPMRVDFSGWNVWPGTTTKLRSWASKAWYAFYVAHALYKTLSLLCILLFVRGIPLHQMIIHGVLAGGTAVFGFWYYILYVKYPDVNAALIRMTLTGTITGGSTRKLFHRNVLLML